MAATPPPPAHVAIIMDGNGRWAQQHLRPRAFGHKAGRLAVDRHRLRAARGENAQFVRIQHGKLAAAAA